MTFIKSTSAVSDAYTSSGRISKIGVVEEVLDVADDTAKSAVGGSARATDAGRSTGETLIAIRTDKVPDGTGFEADGGAELHDGASIGT